MGGGGNSIHDPSSTVAIESKFPASAERQPSTMYSHVAAMTSVGSQPISELASEAKLRAALSRQPMMRSTHVAEIVACESKFQASALAQPTTS